MSEWYINWQNKFANVEIKFEKKDNQIKTRIADVLIEEHDLVLSLQYKNKININNYINDYKIHNKKIIWIIDGNNKSIIITEKNTDECTLTFKIGSNYDNFILCEYIFIDIDNKIYKIYIENIKSNMIDVCNPYTKEEFINLLKLNDSKIYENNISKQCKLYIKQQGAGNGKTYGLIQMLDSDDFQNYKVFIIVTFQHSAKYQIFREFEEQIKDKKLNFITNIKYINTCPKKYKITYYNNKSNLDCEINISTIDAFMYCLGDNTNTTLNMFEGIVMSIIEDCYIEQKINFNSSKLTLNKKMCLICDETQDLPIYYAKAIIKIMKDTYINSYIVGDKLQSLKYIKNSFTYLLDTDHGKYIEKYIYPAENICRRFYQSNLIKFVNTIVPFSKYDLNEITPWKEDITNNENLVVIFEGEFIDIDIDNNDIIDIIEINIEVSQIMKYYDKEVLENNYEPNDFLIVTPFTNKNPLVDAIDIAINKYWIDKKNTDIYHRYSIFHKAQANSSINLEESKDTTRIVSIHTSKGDGRNVVFVIGLTEFGLLGYSKFSNEFNNNTDNLIYDSLIHVALTRMKKKLYIRFINNGDDIAKKLIKYQKDNNIPMKFKPKINIRKNIKFSNVVDMLKTNNDFKILKKLIIDEKYPIINIFEEEKKEEKLIIDMSHHKIRYTTMIIFLYIKILKKDEEFMQKQIYAIFNALSTQFIYKAKTWKEYNQYLSQRNLCILQLSTGTEYVKYYNIIYNFMKSVKNKLNEIKNNTINELCPFESIILYYMIQLSDQGKYTDITINELYYIVDIYNKSFNSTCDGHEHCLCKKLFNSISPIEDKLNKYLLNHYESITCIGNIYEKFLIKYPKIKLLINHFIFFKGANTEIKLYKMFNLIAYDDENTFIIYVKPQFNSINYYETLIDSIYDTFLINNLKNDNNYDDDKKTNYERFGNKNIITVIFSLNNDKYNICEWNTEEKDLINTNKDFFIENIKNSILNTFLIESICLYEFFIYSLKKSLSKLLDNNKSIKYIISRIKKDKYIDKLSPFVLKFFEQMEIYIKCEIKSLLYYQNKENFTKELEDFITEFVNDFIGE